MFILEVCRTDLFVQEHVCLFCCCLFYRAFCLKAGKLKVKKSTCSFTLAETKAPHHPFYWKKKKKSPTDGSKWKVLFFLDGYHWSYLSSKVLGFHVHFAETKKNMQPLGIVTICTHIQKNAHLCQKMVQQKIIKTSIWSSDVSLNYVEVLEP